MHATDGAAVARKGTRPVYFPEAGDYLQARVFDRYALRPGDSISGPAIVEERESTVFIGPAGHASIDERRNLIVEIGSVRAKF